LNETAAAVEEANSSGHLASFLGKDYVGVTVDVFGVNHHGLALSNNPALVRALEPWVAIINNGPRKGAEAPVLETLRGSRGFQAVFQLYRNLELEEADQAPREAIANLDEECEGDFIHLDVDPSGKRYRLTVGRGGAPVEFTTR
jgi:hypothetical protein